MADIRKREGKKGITYQVRYTAGGRALYKTFKRRKDAQEFLNSHGASDTNTLLRARSGKTVADAVDHWLDICKNVGRHGREPVEPATLRAYKLHGQTINGMPIATVQLSDLTAPDCVQFRTDILKAHSRVYAKKILTSFKSALAEAETAGMIGANPAAGVRIVRSGRATEADKVVIPTKNEMKAILEAAEASLTLSTGKRSDGNTRAAWKRYLPMLMTSVFTGLRPSELRGLSWKQVDLVNGKIEVTQRADEKGEIGPTKSASGRRTIHLPGRVVDVLRTWKGNARIGKAHLVFPNGVGNVEALGNIHRRAWYPLLTRAGVVDREGEAKYRFNACRHFYASMLIDQGRNPKQVQVAMGHSSIAVTMDIYGHLFPDDDETAKEAADLMASDLL